MLQEGVHINNYFKKTVKVHTFFVFFLEAVKTFKK